MEVAEKILVYGKIPFLILLEDSLDENFQPINRKEIELVEDNNSLMSLLYLKKQIKLDEKDHMLPTEDPYGEITYSKFCIEFQRILTKESSLEKMFCVEGKEQFDNDLITDKVFELINKFITVYKHTSKPYKDWILTIHKRRLCPFRIQVFNKKGEIIQKTEHLDYRGTGVLIGNVIDEEHLTKLKHFCKCHSVSIDTTAEFRSEANKFKNMGDYKSALIFLAFFIEKFIFREVRYKLEKIGYSIDDIDKLIKKGNGKYIHRYKAIELITKNTEYKESKQFQDYEEFIVTPRNEIAHNDNYIIDEELSEKMFQIGASFIDYLLELLGYDLEEIKKNN